MTSTISEIENQSSKTFIFRSKLPNIPISNNLSLHSYCFEKVSEFSERTCLITASNGKTYTFAETHLISKKTAIGLSNLGIKKGDVIMILLQNCPEFVFSFMGASMLGAITTTSNPFYPPSDIFKQFSASGARIIITQSQFVEKLQDPTENFPKIGEDLTVITIDDPPENCLHFSVISNSKESEIESVSIDPDDPVVLPFSSGTTGFSKGVILTHKSMITTVAQVVDGENPTLYLRSDDIVLCVLPLFHKFCLKCVLLCSLRAGVGILLMEKFKIGTMLEWIQKYQVSVAPIAPPLVLALVNNPMVESFDLSSIRIVMSGAAPVGKELDEALRNRLPQAIFGQVYGMTEAGVMSMCLGFAKQPFPSKSGSCGAVTRNLELKIVDPKTGFSLWHNQPGEICIRGPQIMKGYLNNIDATSTTIDVEGWLHTGDIGYVDDDEEVFIVDRLKELIKVKGFQVPPAELEALLLSHPSISDAAVVPQKDVVAGEVPVAFVVPSRDDFELTEEAIKEFIAKQVVFYKRLHKVYFILAIPKSPSGKILRRVLRAKLASGS